jgi:hypothetical protein
VSNIEITESHAREILRLLSFGLVNGLGTPEPHLEEGLELYPHCMWCGKKILVAADVEDAP